VGASPRIPQGGADRSVRAGGIPRSGAAYTVGGALQIPQGSGLLCTGGEVDWGPGRYGRGGRMLCTEEEGAR